MFFNILKVLPANFLGPTSPGSPLEFRHNLGSRFFNDFHQNPLIYLCFIKVSFMRWCRF